LLANLALGFYNVGAVWLVQMVCYPLWSYVGPGEWRAYHDAWWHGIQGVILVPAGLSTLGCIAMFWLRPPGVSIRAVWLGLALQVLWIALTVVWWGRWMAQLVQLSGPVYGALYHRLLSTHWLRVSIITAYGVLMVWMAARSYMAQENDTLIPRTANA
jgi:hypothetical protein